MKNIQNFVIIILFFIFILLLTSLFKYLKINNSNIENFSNENEDMSKLTYYRCDEKELGNIISDIFKRNNIVKSNDNWNIYTTCGYNDAEAELLSININNNLNKDKDKFIYAVNGMDLIVSKNEIWSSLVKCYGRKEASTLMPESFVLDDANEVQLFRQYFNPSRNDIYILKKNLQRKEGLKLTRDFFEILDAEKEDYRVVQRYITNLYLINGRKVNLRIYILVMIKNGKIHFYMSNKGKCIYTNKKYNDDDLDFESNITSYHLDMDVYKENPRDFNELRTYIDVTNNKEGDGNKLFDKIHYLMKKVSVCLSNNLYQSENIKNTITFQLFGADVIFDNKLHPFLLEFNKGPDMSSRDTIDYTMKYRVQYDMFKTVGIIPDDGNNSFELLYKTDVLNHVVDPLL